MSSYVELNGYDDDDGGNNAFTTASSMTELQTWRFELINIYITDALNTRSPNKKLLNGRRRDASNYKYYISIRTAYKLSHNSVWSIFVYLLIWLHCSLIIVEPYANTQVSNESTPWWLLTIESCILLAYSVDTYLHFISHDAANYWQLPWVKLLVVCIALNMIDIIVASIFYIFRFSALLRPLFLVLRSQFLRATVRSIWNSFGRVLDVLLLVCLYILIFAVFGYVLFSEKQLGIGVHAVCPSSDGVSFDTDCEGAVCPNANGFQDTDCEQLQAHGNVFFDTLYRSYLSLTVCMTTANFPDVMMQSFHDQRWTAVFFAAFIGFGIYYWIAVIFAVIYHHYHQDNATFVQQMTNNRARALDAAFKQTIIFTKELELGRSLDADALHKLDYSAEKIYFSVFRQLLKFRRPGIDVARSRVLYNALTEVKNVQLALTRTSEDDGVGIAREQWQKWYKYVTVEIFRDPMHAVESVLESGKQTARIEMVVGNHKIYGNKLYFTWLRFRSLLYRLFTHFVISKLIDTLVWTGTLVLVYELSLPAEHAYPSLDVVSDVLIYVFVVEVTLRFVAFGRFFWRDGFNVLDFVVIYVSWGMDVYYEHAHGVASVQQPRTARSNGMVAFRLLRFVRALGTIDRFKLIISTSVTVFKKVGVLFTLQLCVFYVFAVIGMFCFGGVVTKEAVLQHLHTETVVHKNVDAASFWQYIRDSFYYDNNMNHFSNAMTVMLELTVVNQWHIITRMYAELTSPWSYIYFYAFYFISVLLVVNVLTAFVIESFMKQFESAKKEQAQHRRNFERQKKLKQLSVYNKRQRVEWQSRQNRKRHQRQLSNRVERHRSRASLPLRDFNNLLPSLKDRLLSTSPKLANVRSSESDFMQESILSDGSELLEEYVGELNTSENDDWHKWIAIALIYEFDWNDVIRGTWRYDRRKNTADFYEQIYGDIEKPTFHEYLQLWNEALPEDDDVVFAGQTRSETLGNESTASHHSLMEVDDIFSSEPSMHGAAHEDHDGHSVLSAMDDDVSELYHSSQQSIRGKGKHIFIPKTALCPEKNASSQGLHIAAMSVLSMDDQGNVDQIRIKGPKQQSLFSALSTAPQVGFAPLVKKKHVSKVSKMLDFHQRT